MQRAVAHLAMPGVLPRFRFPEGICHDSQTSPAHTPGQGSEVLRLLLKDGQQLTHIRRTAPLEWLLIGLRALPSNAFAGSTPTSLKETLCCLCWSQVLWNPGWI